MNQIYRLFCFIVLLSSSPFANAQVATGTQIDCGAIGSLVIKDFGNTFCYDTTEAVAKQMFLADLAGFLSCNENCFSGGLFDCSVTIRTIAQGNLSQTSNGFCPSSSIIRVSWSCSECTRNTSTGSGGGNPGAEGTESSCSQTSRYVMRPLKIHRYPRTRFPNRAAAEAQFRADILAQLSCRNTCLDPNLFDCEPQLTENTLSLINSNGSSFYIGPSDFLSIRWRCTDCERRPIGGGTTGGGSTTVDDHPNVRGGTSSCGNGTQFVARDMPKHCYKEAFPDGSLEEARAQFRADLISLLTCEINCEDRDETCTPVITSTTINGNLGSNLCSGSYIAFNWKCTDCTEVRDGETPPGEGSGEGQHLQGSGDEWSSLREASPQGPARLETFTPNPFSDHLNIELSVQKTAQAITLRIIDIHGKVYYQKQHRTSGDKLNINLNLGTAPVGTYYALLEADGQIIDQAKLILVR